MIEWIVAVVAVLGILITIGGIWLKINMIVKELQVRLINLEKDILEVKNERLEIVSIIEKNNNLLWKKLEGIEKKIDDKFIDLTVLKTEHEQMKNFGICQFKKDNEK